ncbi:Uncharacterized protein FKW44_023168 [Caligus rogercresseyi]|uniref:Transposable element Tcb1 transposase n=1 Tax=Caligus rogercresseyi TaxID=217165 RepID=A0A7T8JTY6_CALRO|nr:Uncharacterized protein FKW44_023168 [Caligus rogercresseyi]
MVWVPWSPMARNYSCSGLQDGVKINKIVYLDVLKTKVFTWIQEKFGGVPVCFQQDRALTHIAKIVQNWCAVNFTTFGARTLVSLIS